jgi:hypothetical protein
MTEFLHLGDAEGDLRVTMSGLSFLISAFAALLSLPDRLPADDRVSANAGPDPAFDHVHGRLDGRRVS